MQNELSSRSFWPVQGRYCFALHRDVQVRWMEHAYVHYVKPIEAGLVAPLSGPAGLLHGLPVL